MSKGRKRRYEDEPAGRKRVLIYVDTYGFDKAAVVSEPMPYDQALRVLNKAREQEGPDGFDPFELQQTPIIKDTKC
jgi:hypothetical protein